MSYVKPLSASTNGRPIAVAGTDVTVHSGVAGEVHLVHLIVFNNHTVAQALLVKVGGVSVVDITSFAVDGIQVLDFAISAADAVTVTLALAGLVSGYVEVDRSGGKPGSL